METIKGKPIVRKYSMYISSLTYWDRGKIEIISQTYVVNRKKMSLSFRINVLTLPIRALSTLVSLPRSSWMWSSSESGSGSNVILLVSPLKDSLNQSLCFSYLVNNLTSAKCCRHESKNINISVISCFLHHLKLI